MGAELIGMGMFFGIVFGVFIGLLIIKIKNNSIKKKAIKRIEKQRLKFMVNGKQVDFFGNIKKGQEKEKKKEEKVKEKKHKKVRVKKKKKKKK